MSLPHSRNRTYNPLTEVASADLNDLQDWMVRAWDALAAADLVVTEHFVAQELGDTIWLAANIGPASALVDDSANDGSGAWRQRPEAAANSCSVSTVAFAIGARRFRWAARLRVTAAPGHADSYVRVGLGGANGNIEFDLANANWKVRRGADPLVDTGVAPSPAYHLFELRGDGVNVQALIDGAQVAFVAVPNPFRPFLRIETRRDGADGSLCEVYIDSVKLWVAV